MDDQGAVLDLDLIQRFRCRIRISDADFLPLPRQEADRRPLLLDLDGGHFLQS